MSREHAPYTLLMTFESDLQANSQKGVMKSFSIRSVFRRSYVFCPFPSTSGGFQATDRLSEKCNEGLQTDIGVHEVKRAYLIHVSYKSVSPMLLFFALRTTV